MIYIPNVRAIKGTSPTALDMNSLANNLEYLKEQRVTRNCSLQLSGNQVVARSGLTGFGTLTYDTVLLDDSSMFSGGILTPPSDAQFIRMMVNFVLSGPEVNSIGVYPQISNHELAGSDVQLYFNAYHVKKDNAGTWAGVSVVHYDSGWVQYVSSLSNYQDVVLGLSVGVTVLANESTWLSVEVI